MRRALIACLAVWMAPAPASARSGDDLSATPRTHLVVIVGLGGEPRYEEAFHGWAATLIDAARGRWGLGEEDIVYLADREGAVNARSRSTRENVERALRELAGRAGASDRIFIVLIGHGSTRDGEARFNLRGPDLTATEFAGLLDAFPTQEIVFVNAASASGDFIPALSGPNRTIITATRSGYERNQTVFGRFFVEAFAGDGADVDKDDRVSALEAFVYARREVVRTYEEEGRLLTEHALLDDNGDGEGSAEPEIDGRDGALARTLFLAGEGAARTLDATASDPRLAALYEERAALERRVAELRRRKDELAPQEYETRLEELLVELALKARQIRELEEGGQ